MLCFIGWLGDEYNIILNKINKEIIFDIHKLVIDDDHFLMIEIENFTKYTQLLYKYGLKNISIFDFSISNENFFVERKQKIYNESFVKLNEYDLMYMKLMGWII